MFMIYLKPQVTLEFNFLLIHQCRSFFDTPEEIFTTGHISHAGQTIGMIVAETEAIARKAVKAVKITYKNHKEPILVSFEEKDTQLLLRRNNENKDCRNKYNTSNAFFSKSFLVEVL
jgi:xanthine dehydrogenase molybdopterin-binding subunit B